MCAILAGFDWIEVLFKMQVPLLDLRLQYAPLKAEIMRQIEQVADSQTLVLGPQVEKLERSVCEYAGAAHAIGVSSGTDAQLVLMIPTKHAIHKPTITAYLATKSVQLLIV